MRVHDAMMTVLLSLAGLALTAPVHARSAVSVRSSKSAHPAKVDAPVADVAPRSESATRVADWIAATGDNGSLPYIIIDKQAAALSLFNSKGKLLGNAPVLIGIALGDEATPGIGSKNLAEIGPAEKTTPAGRFLAKFGVAAGKSKVLWVDYATSVALHPVPTANRKEHRRERMLSPRTDDNRITFGCINVPTMFYNKSVRPSFLRRGGYVYVLPDTKSLEDVFPRLHAYPFVSAALPEASNGPASLRN